MIRPILRGIACAGAGLWLTLAPALAGDAPQQSARSAAEIMDILMWNREPVGGPFALTDQAGHQRTDKEFRGRLMLVYFGFTYCPDVCPTTLQQIGDVLQALGPKGKDVRALFIAVDPERDTPEALKTYLASFDPRIVGLTGSPDEVNAAVKAYRAYVRKVPTKEGDYTMEHTALVYVMSGQNRFLNALNLARPSGEAAAELAKML